MRLRQMAVAFLINEEQEVLFLKKRKDNTLLAGFLVPIGGHIENHEINNPENACFREIEEETGLKKESIKDLNLRYIMFRNSKYVEIRIQYVFFASVSKKTPLTESDEGPLEWIKLKEISNRNISETSREIMKHYNNTMNPSKEIYVGSMKSLSGSPAITWGVLQDWEEFII